MAPTKKLVISNKEQIRLLIHKMEQNPPTTRGQRQFGETKQAQDLFWEELSGELNSLGPPTRIRQDWQRVWTNYKQNLRRKVSSNAQNTHATGGGPSQEVPLTALEESVADLLNDRTAVCPPGETFGGTTADAVSVEVEGDENAVPPTPRRSKHRREDDKMEALNKQTSNQKNCVKKLDNIERTLHKLYQVEREKLAVLKKREAQESEIRELERELKQQKILLVQAQIRQLQ